MKTLIEGSVIIIVGLLAVWGAYQIPPAYSESETWAGLVPMFVACSLVLIGVMMTISGLRMTADNSQISKQTLSRTDLDVSLLVVLALIYHQAIVKFGYLIPTAITAPIVLAFFGVRSPAGLIVSAILCPIVFHLIFFKLLGVFPPYGEIFDVLDLIGG